METKAKIFVDGFFGMAVIDSSDTHADIIQALNEDSVWEVFDGVQQLPRGVYEVTLDFHWESNFPESGDEFVIENVKSELLPDYGAK